MAMRTGVKFNGYDVADWSREISRLKRAGQDEEALDLYEQLLTYGADVYFNCFRYQF